MSKTVAEHLVNTLADAGVRRVYGIVGDSLNPVTDAIRRSETIDWIHVRNEEAGAFAAVPDVRPADADLARLAELLNSARTVTLFCGIGCAGAHDEVLALAEKLKAPVGYSLRGKQWIEHDNPYGVGMTGLLGWGA